MPEEKSFPVMLKEMRMKEGLTQRDLSKLVNLSSGCIAQYETGRITPSKKNLSKLNDIFGIEFNVKPKTRTRKKKEETTTAINEVPYIDILFFKNVDRFIKTNIKDEHTLCALCGVCDGYFSRKPEDRDPITWEFAVKVSEALHVDISEFVKDPEQERVKRQIDMYRKKIKELEDKLNA